MTDFIDKMILVYSEDGRAKSTVEYPWPDGTLELYATLPDPFIVTGKADISAIYVEDGAVYPRPTPTWSAPTEPVPAGGVFAITGLPVGAVIRIGVEAFEVTDGIFELESPVAETLPYTVEAWPHYPTNGVAVFE
ncbi:hypothetical protein D3C72_275720 [compost metagenome]